MSTGVETTDRVSRTDARAALYRLLSQAFAYPDERGLTTLIEEDLPAASAAAEAFGDDVAEPLAAVGHRLAHAGPERIAEDYERVFTHVVSSDWPPYETAYTSKGIFQQANDLADIAGFYAAYGVEISDEERERPDHLSVELELMYLLAFKEAYALRHHTRERADACLEDQRRFFEDHLGRWAPELARRLARGAGDSPYADLAEVCGAFMEAEAAFLGVDPDPVDGSVEVVEPDGLECGVACGAMAAEGSGGADA